jgi:hypothetical protein
MSDAGNAKFLEIFRGKMTQHFNADVILAECRLVSFKAQVFEPACDIHRRFLRLGDALGGIEPCWNGRVQSTMATCMGASSRPFPGLTIPEIRFWPYYKGSEGIGRDAKKRE